METIKLLKLDDVVIQGETTTRLQSQLYAGRNDADFIIENGVLKVYSKGKNGFNFYPTDIPYKIVNNKEELFIQQL